MGNVRCWYQVSAADISGSNEACGDRQMFNRIAGLHRNEAGNESMQTVMIMAVGALIMIGIHALFQSDIGEKVKGHVGSVLGGDFTFGDGK